MLRFHKHYFILAAIMLLLEVFIALYMHDAIIRPFVGDFLVVILLYCLVKSLFNFPAVPAAFWVLIFAYAVEVSLYFHLVSLLGLQNSKLACVLLGTSFSFIDLLMYTLGVLLVIVVENIYRSLKNF